MVGPLREPVTSEVAPTSEVLVGTEAEVLVGTEAEVLVGTEAEVLVGTEAEAGIAKKRTHCWREKCWCELREGIDAED